MLGVVLEGLSEFSSVMALGLKLFSSLAVRSLRPCSTMVTHFEDLNLQRERTGLELPDRKD